METLRRINQKILSPEQLQRWLAYWRFKDQKIVFTNGCFDLLHKGHVDYLSRAADLGDVLLIGLNTDASVQRLKGPSRPITDEGARALVMASLAFVTGVILFDEDTPYELIKTIQPDFLVKGSDYKAEEVVGFDIVTARGGKVVTLEFLEGYSTTRIEQKIRNAGHL